MMVFFEVTVQLFDRLDMAVGTTTLLTMAKNTTQAAQAAVDFYTEADLRQPEFISARKVTA